jgi:peptidoglycan/xylan/chitin deacetylase (PgdA/CDA1 family)
MPRRAIALLPVVAAAVVLALALGSGGSRPSARPSTAQGAGEPAQAAKRSQPGAASAAALPRTPADISGDSARRMHIPILMYHVIGNRPPGAPNADLWVTPGAFASEMAALRRAGYWGITLRQAFDAWRKGSPLPRKPVVVSFDDGYLGHYTKARPVLRQQGWPGVLNLELRNVGPGGITPHQVGVLIANGWEIDSHTIDHPDLTYLNAQQLRHELVDSRAQLRARFGVRADFFCYPAGRYDNRVVAAVKAAGYQAATTTREGYARGTSPFTLARVRVSATDSAQSLLAKLAAERQS